MTRRSFRRVFWPLFLLGVALFLTGYVVFRYYTPTVLRAILPAPLPAAGAALDYRLAMAALPALSQEEKDLLLFVTLFQPEAAAALLARCDDSLQALSQGAARSECEWGVDLGRWPPESGEPEWVIKTSYLAQLLALRARLHLANGEPLRAVDDLLRLFRFARHLGQPCNFVIGGQAAGSYERIGLLFILKNLAKFDPESLRALADGMDKLPSYPSARYAAALELEVMNAYLRNIVVRAINREPFSVEPVPGMEHLKLVDATPFIVRYSPAGCVFLLKRFEKQTRAFLPLLEPSYPESRLKMQAFLHRVNRSPWWPAKISYNFLRMFSVACLKDAQLDTFRAITRAAMDARLENRFHTRQEARLLLAEFRDPVDDAPLMVEEVENGLKISFRNEKDRESMSFIFELPPGE